MKKIITLLCTALCANVLWAQTFTDTTSSGSVLHFSITSTNPKEVKISGYNESPTLDSLFIPSTVVYNDSVYSVVEINQQLFNNTRRLVHVTIPNSVRYVNNGVFQFSNIVSVIMPDSLELMGDVMFSNCKSLEYVSLPLNITTIGIRTFAECDSLRNINIPSSVTSIREGAFTGCNNLRNIGSLSNINYIETSAFKNCTSLDSIALISANSISKEAFANCTSLEHIEFGDSIKYIGQNAFHNTGYTNDYANITGEIVYANNYKYLLEGLPQLPLYSLIHDSVILFAEAAFSNCTTDTYLELPVALKEIPDKAFYNFTGLRQITLPDSLEIIGKSAFNGCSNLESISFPTKLRCIKDNAFQYCNSITSFYLPHNIETIGKSPFAYCDNLETIYYNCKKANGIQLGNNCPNLTTVVFGDSVTKIPNLLFSKTVSLKNIVFSNTIDTIGHSAFERTSIENIVISNSVKYIDRWAFYECFHLKNVTLGRSVNYIEQAAFYYSDSIHTTTFKQQTPPTFMGGNYSLYDNNTIYIPCGTINAYRNTWIGNPMNNSTLIDSNITFDMSISSSDTTLGTVRFVENSCTNIEFEAIPIEGCRFVSWNDGNIDNPRTVELSSDTSFYAIFVIQYSIAVLSANDTMGTVSGSGTFDNGDEITILANPHAGYKFTGWTDGNMDNPRSVIVNSDSTFIATFAPKMIYTITVSSEDQSMGVVSGSGTFEEETEICIAASARSGYHFKEWNDGDTNKIRYITVVCDSTFIARFERNIGIENADALSNLTFYPNPTSATITFNRTDIKKIEVLDAVGRTAAVYENSHIIDLSKLSKGHYTMRITTAEGVAVRRVVKQ